jgi:hypothetical protein
MFNKTTSQSAVKTYEAKEKATSASQINLLLDWMSKRIIDSGHHIRY